MIVPANTQTPWGLISYPMKLIGVNLNGYFLFEYLGSNITIPRGISVYIRNHKPKDAPGSMCHNFLSLTAHQQGLDFLEKIYQSQKSITS